MPIYGPWHEAVVQDVTISDGAVPGIPIGNSVLAEYIESTGGTPGQALNGFFVTSIFANHPVVAHSYDGTTAVLDIASPLLTFDAVNLNPYLIGTVPEGATVEIDDTAPYLGNSAVLGATAQVFITPLTYSGIDTATLYTSGVAGFASGSWPEPGVNIDAVYATWNYGDASTIQINDQAMTPSGGLYSVSTFVWDSYAVHGGPVIAAGHSATSTVAISLIVQVQSPRWRFVYATSPRLRQFPRDDQLGGTPRPGGQSRSVQATARQGWNGTYR